MKTKRCTHETGQKGSILIGCAIGCATLALIAAVSAFLILRWLFALTEVPDPQSAMLADAQGFVVARLDPDDKAVVELIRRIATETAGGEASADLKPEEKRLPWPVRWLVGDDSSAIIQKFLPIQIVLSDNPGAQQMAIVFSPGRGRGLASLLSRSLTAAAEKAEKGETQQEFVKYRGMVILRGKSEGEPRGPQGPGGKSNWWFTLDGTNFCASNSAETAKSLVDALAKPPAPSKITALYPALHPNAVACGVSAHFLRMRQITAWLCPDDPQMVGSFTPGVIKQGTFKLTLNEQMTMHAQIELICANPQVSQQMQKGMQNCLTPKQEANKISGLRVSIQDEKLFLDLDVPEVDKLIIAAIEVKKEERAKEAGKIREKPKAAPAEKAAAKEPAPAKAKETPKAQPAPAGPAQKEGASEGEPKAPQGALGAPLRAPKQKEGVAPKPKETPKPAAAPAPKEAK